MISKHLGKAAQRVERLARTEAAAGHDVTALDLFYGAASGYADAQHAIFMNNTEKRKLHESSLRCYDEIRRLSPTRIDHVEIPWGDTVVTGLLHFAPVEGPAPTIFMIPGCDMTKEMVVPHAMRNWATTRGAHLFVFDGPGQGEANLRGIKLTTDNYEDAASTALSHLLELPEVDQARVGLFAMSFGSYWGARVAAQEDRFKAVVLQWASVADKHLQFDGAVSPRYKQLFAYLIGADSEAELDEFIDAMDLAGFAERISSPTLMTLGEFDPRSPLDEVLPFFDELSVPAEMWVFADQHHQLTLRGGAGPVAAAADSHGLSADWLMDRLAGQPLAHEGEVIYLEQNGTTPNDPQAQRRRHWYDD
jgi:dipeptidyl aminopeptidase/acylaminoacyl peptidase